MIKLSKCGRGGEATIMRQEGLFRVMCYECLILTATKVKKERAIEAWNRAMGRPKEAVREDWNTAMGRKSENDQKDSS